MTSSAFIATTTQQSCLINVSHIGSNSADDYLNALVHTIWLHAYVFFFQKCIRITIMHHYASAVHPVLHIGSRY